MATPSEPHQIRYYALFDRFKKLQELERRLPVELKLTLAELHEVIGEYNYDPEGIRGAPSSQFHTKDLVLEELCSRNQPCSSGEIAEAIDINRRNVNDALARLKRDGLAKKVGRRKVANTIHSMENIWERA